MKVFILIVMFVVTIFSTSNIRDILDLKKLKESDTNKGNLVLHISICLSISLAITAITIAYDVILMYLLIKGI